VVIVTVLGWGKDRFLEVVGIMEVSRRGAIKTARAACEKGKSFWDEKKAEEAKIADSMEVSHSEK